MFAFQRAVMVVATVLHVQGGRLALVRHRLPLAAQNPDGTGGAQLTAPLPTLAAGTPDCMPMPLRGYSTVTAQRTAGFLQIATP